MYRGDEKKILIGDLIIIRVEESVRIKTVFQQDSSRIFLVSSGKYLPV